MPNYYLFRSGLSSPDPSILPQPQETLKTLCYPALSYDYVYDYSAKQMKRLFERSNSDPNVAHFVVVVVADFESKSSRAVFW